MGGGLRCEHDRMFTSYSAPKNIANCLLVYLTHVPACRRKERERFLAQSDVFEQSEKADGGRQTNRRKELQAERGGVS